MTRASISALHDDWPAVSGLLDEALALPPTQRDAWLAGLAGVSPQNLDSLRALLATQAEIETGDFLADLPPLSPESSLNVGAAPGGIVGPYKLISQIGQGGMASVWLAERADGLIKRQVALKLPAVAWGEAFATRLAREREILASLTHEHIARLYDAGVDAQGRPFLAMELIDGEPIDAFCRERQLPLTARIDLLLQVMAAVSHAHARLVVHRDLKPSNILVSADAKVSLLDFGIAKLLEGELTEETALTRAAGHALTPDYASPEQIRGEPLGTASDIYSLGVVAYELLAGGRPYRLKRSSAAEFAQAIADAEAPLASESAEDKALKRQLKGDLDAILNKALKKRPDERYVSMDAFAQDLRRWRDGEPVQARPDGLAYRAVKFIGRYRLQVAASGAVLVALLGGMGTALWQAREARLQAARALTEAATAASVQGFMESVFKSNSRNQADPKRAAATTARELLDRGAERIDTELAPAPMARLRLLGILGAMYEDMDANDRQLVLQRKRLALAQEITGPKSDETVLAMAGVANALASLDQRAEADSMLDEASAMLDARKDSSSPARLRVLIQSASIESEINPEKALVAGENALTLLRGRPPTAEMVSTLLAHSRTALHLGKPAAARGSLMEALQLAEKHPELGGGLLGELYGLLGATQRRLGDFAQARVSHLASIDVYRRQGAAPTQIHDAEMMLAVFLYNTGRYEESMQVIRPGLAWSETAGAASDDITAASVRDVYARTLVAYGRASEGLAELDTALGIARKIRKDVEFFEAPQLSFRALALIDLGRLAEARAALDRSQVMADARTIPAYQALIKPVERRWLVASDRASEALALLHAANAAQPPQPGGAASVGALVESAWLTLEAGDARTAQTQAEQALAIIRSGGVADYQRDHEARATLVLGRALLRQERTAEALPVLEKAVELHRAVYDPDKSPAVANAWIALSAARRALRNARAAEAEAAARRVRAVSPSGR